MSIQYIKASGKEIVEITDRIEHAVNGYPSAHVSMACIIIAVMAQKPDVAPETLQDCVKGVSEWIAACLFDGSGSGAIN